MKKYKHSEVIRENQKINLEKYQRIIFTMKIFIFLLISVMKSEVFSSNYMFLKPVSNQGNTLSQLWRLSAV